MADTNHVERVWCYTETMIHLYILGMKEDRGASPGYLQGAVYVCDVPHGFCVHPPGRACFLPYSISLVFFVFLLFLEAREMCVLTKMA
jgi:hypothetical protein